MVSLLCSVCPLSSNKTLFLRTEKKTRLYIPGDNWNTFVFGPHELCWDHLFGDFKLKKNLNWSFISPSVRIKLHLFFKKSCFSVCDNINIYILTGLQEGLMFCVIIILVEGQVCIFEIMKSCTQELFSFFLFIPNLGLNY